MKKNKFILSALLAGYLVTTSCTETRDPSEKIKYDFTAKVTFPETVSSGKKHILHIKLASDVYKDGALDHEGVYMDDQKSFLISPKGDTIKPGQTFSIPNMDKLNTFNFYSEDLGEHNLKFIFKNSKDITVTKEHKVLLEKATFKFNVKKYFQSITIDTPLEIEYSHEAYDQLKHNYKLKFEVEGNYNATLNGHKEDEWFDVFDASGKLTYIPLTVGTHKVRITSKNYAGTKKVDSFTIISKGVGIPVIKSFTLDKLIIKGAKRSNCQYTGCRRYIWNHYVKGFQWKLYAHSGNDKKYIKGKLTFFGLKNMVHNFEMKDGKDQILGLWFHSNKHQLDEDFLLTDGQLIDYELELENSYGKKYIHKGTVPIVLDYEGRY